MMGMHKLGELSCTWTGLVVPYSFVIDIIFVQFSLSQKLLYIPFIYIFLARLFSKKVSRYCHRRCR